ncbi:MAG: efflux RND transporter periplasmic adaptor subunit [Gelidibacter sp.]
MKTIKLPIVMSLSFIALFWSCGDKQQAPQGPQGPMPFQVTTIPQENVTGFTIFPTSIEGVNNSEVRSKISGYITEVLVDEGQKVRKGQTLFRLETQSLTQDADAAKANVNAAQVELDKLKPLVEKNIISSVQLETAKAKLMQAQSAYNSIGANIGYATIKSPVDGYVGAIRLRVGNLVSPTSQEPLTTVSDISKVYAYFSMNEKEYLDFIQKTEGTDIASKIKNLPKVTLILANGSTYDQEGTIETINSQVNVHTGSIAFRAIFNNDARILTNGNSGKIKIPKAYNNAVVVPMQSTYEQQGSYYVYKLGADDMAVATRINVLASVDNLYIISDGLKKGDKIVANGISKLRGDSKITPMEIPFDSVAKPAQTFFR